MTTVLHLKNWPEFRKYEITENGLKVEFKTNEGYNQQTLKFEDIGFDELVVKYTPSPVATGLFISVLLNIVLGLVLFMDELKTVSPGISSSLSISLVMPMSIWAGHVFKFKKEKYIKGQINLPFWYFQKQESEVDDFIAALKQAKREYMRRKYLKIEETDNAIQTKQKLAWLKEEEYITSEEFIEWCAETDKRDIIKGF